MYTIRAGSFTGIEGSQNFKNVIATKCQVIKCAIPIDNVNVIVTFGRELIEEILIKRVA